MNHDILSDLQKIRQELVTKRGNILEAVDYYRTDIDNAKDALQSAERQERLEFQKHETIQAELKRLQDHMNGLPTKPQVLLERIGVLGVDEEVAARQHGRATEAVAERRKQSENASASFMLAGKDLAKVDKDIAEIDVQICQVRGF
jgi:chromosome segregation ATPase